MLEKFVLYQKNYFQLFRLQLNIISVVQYFVLIETPHHQGVIEGMIVW
jgi:hypothetical protein